MVRIERETCAFIPSLGECSGVEAELFEGLAIFFFFLVDFRLLGPGDMVDVWLSNGWLLLLLLLSPLVPLFWNQNLWIYYVYKYIWWFCCCCYRECMNLKVVGRVGMHVCNLIRKRGIMHQVCGVILVGVPCFTFVTIFVHQ